MSLPFKSGWVVIIIIIIVVVVVVVVIVTVMQKCPLLHWQRMGFRFKFLA
jgi:hypothetical protein